MQSAKTNSVTGVLGGFCKRDIGDLPHNGLSQLAFCVSSLKAKVLFVCVCVCVCVAGPFQFAHASPMKPSNA
jgi:hypothetical protein